MIMNLVAQNNINLLSCSFIVQKFKMYFTRLNSRCWQGHVPFQRFQGEICFLALSMHNPCLKVSSSTFKASNSKLGSYHIASLQPPLLLPFSTFKDPYEYIQLPILRLTDFRKLNSICNCNSLLPYDINYSKVPRIRMQTLLGDHSPAYHTLFPLSLKLAMIWLGKSPAT